MAAVAFSFLTLQKRINECHNLIMSFMKSLLFGILHLELSPALCLFFPPLCPLSTSFNFLFFIISTHFHYPHPCTLSPLLSSMCPTFPILVSFPVLYVFKPAQLSSPCSLPLISPLLQVFTLTGGAAAGQLRPCVRGGNHRGDV